MAAQYRYSEAIDCVRLCRDATKIRSGRPGARTFVQAIAFPSGLRTISRRRDEAMRSIGIAAQTIMLAAKGMGYDSCPMIGFDFDKVAKLINLPTDHVIGNLIAIGRATKPAWPKPGQLPLAEVVIQDRFA